MVASLDDALKLLVTEVTRPLAKSLGETEKATEWGLRLGIIALVEALQRQVADSSLYDKVLKLIDEYRGTDANGRGAACFSPASTAFANSLVDSLLPADRANVVKEIEKAAQLPPTAAASVLSVAAILLLRSLEPEASYEKLDMARSQDRLSQAEANHDLSLRSERRQSTKARTMNGVAAVLEKVRNSRHLLLMFTAAAIAALGFAWRLGTDRGPSDEYVASVKETSLSARGDAVIRTPRDAPPAPAQEASPAVMKQPAFAGLNESRTKSLESASATPTLELRSRVAEQESPELKEAESVMKPAQNPGEAHRDIIQKKLPNGVEVNIPKNGVETQLLDFLGQTSHNSGVFDLDRISFDRAKATLQSSSQEQLQNLAKILKAYPSAKIEINSYTDNRGDKVSNLKLSRERALNVLDELARMGVDKSRMTARGFGDSHPIASNNSEEGRRQNRRISLGVVGT